MAGIEGQKFKILHEKSTVITRAAFGKFDKTLLEIMFVIKLADTKNQKIAFH